jgi:hypothetical protein
MTYLVSCAGLGYIYCTYVNFIYHILLVVVSYEGLRGCLSQGRLIGNVEEDESVGEQAQPTAQ